MAKNGGKRTIEVRLRAGLDTGYLAHDGDRTRDLSHVVPRIALPPAPRCMDAPDEGTALPSAPPQRRKHKLMHHRLQLGREQTGCFFLRSGTTAVGACGALSG